MFEDSNGNFEILYEARLLYEPILSLSLKSITDGLAFALNKAYNTEPALINKYVNSYVTNKGQK